MHKVFLQTLFSSKPKDAYILIWLLRGKRSAWFQDLDAAAAYVERAKAEDTYVGVALSVTDRGIASRCSNDTACGLVGLWADIDVDYPGAHKDATKVLPKTIDDAMKIIEAVGLEPSVIISSGHGLQAWWQFPAAWIFNSTAEREQAYDLSFRWIYWIKAKAKELGWDVDAVFDLARVLRVPGTVNCKEPRKQVPVEILQLNDEHRYAVEDFNQVLGDFRPQRARPSSRRDQPDGEHHYDINPKANPPLEKFEALRDVDRRFEQSWNHTRRDLADQSASSYDMSLATIAASADWDDQEIVDLLIACRRKHGVDLKLRYDYYDRTLARARAALHQERREEHIQEAIRTVTDLVDADAVADHKAEVVSFLSDAIFDGKLQIKRVVGQVGDPPQYRVETYGQRDIKLGGIEAITTQSQFRNRVAEATRLIPRTFSKKEWPKVSQAILDACEEELMGDEATDKGRAEIWLTEYFRSHHILDEWTDENDSQSPLKDIDGIYVSGPAMRKWLAVGFQEKVTPQAFGSTLRAAGCEYGVHSIKLASGRSVPKRLWRVPLQLADGDNRR
jgi:hypothetical protein